MPVNSESPKILYEALYKELKSKYSAVAVYVRDTKYMQKEDQPVGKAIKDFIKLYESIDKGFGWSMPTGFGEDYATVKADLKQDEEIAEQLEKQVQNIRAALLESVKHRVPKPIDIEKMKQSGTYKERFAALNASVSDRMGAWLNEKIDTMTEDAKRKNLEFAHRPELYMEVNNPKTGQMETVKAERYVSYAKRVSKEYRFFERAETDILYDRKQDPDVYMVAPLALRDILENHKERKVEADRRREYVKFINDQHQAYAVWKEQMPKEKKRYEEMIASLGDEVRNRYNAFMEQYNGATSMYSGVEAWLESERSLYEMRKQALTNAQTEADAHFEIYEAAKKPLDEYEKQAEKELKDAKERIEEIKKSPLFKEGHKKKQMDLLAEYTKKEQELGSKLEELDTTIIKDTNDRDAMRKSLMDIADVVDKYKEQLQNLKESQTAENIKAVRDYYERLFKGETKLFEDLSDNHDKLLESAQKYSSVWDYIENEKDAMRGVEEQLNIKQSEVKVLEQSKDNIDNFVKESKKDKTLLNAVKNLFGKGKENELDKQLKDVRIVLDQFKKAAKQANLSTEERMAKKKEILEQISKGGAIPEQWKQLGADLVYFSGEAYKELQAEIKDGKTEVTNYLKIYDQHKTNIQHNIKNAEEIRRSLVDDIDKAIENIAKLTERLEAIQAQSADDAIVQANTVITDKVNAEEKGLIDSRAAIEQGLRDLNESINKKTASREGIIIELNEIAQKREQAERELKVILDEETKLENEESELKKLEEKQKLKKKELEDTIAIAYKNYMQKEEANVQLEEESKKYLEDYELIQKKFDEHEVTSLRHLEDMAKMVQEQQGKLAKDANAQKDYLRMKEEAMCAEYEKRLKSLKRRFIDLMEPQGILKSSNSREFTALKNKYMEFFEPSFKVPSKYDPNELVTVDNPHYVLGNLESMKPEYYNGNNPEKERQDRLKIMTDVTNAMKQLVTVAEKYLEAKGDPVRVTELGRARHFWVSDLKTISEDVDLQLSGMLREEEYCEIAPDLGKVTEKSGLTTEFSKTAGYKYTKEAVERETDSVDIDALRNLAIKEEKPKEKEMENEGPRLS